jgi:hypothetical protein
MQDYDQDQQRHKHGRRSRSHSARVLVEFEVVRSKARVVSFLLRKLSKINRPNAKQESGLFQTPPKVQGVRCYMFHVTIRSCKQHLESRIITAYFLLGKVEASFVPKISQRNKGPEMIGLSLGLD